MGVPMNAMKVEDLKKQINKPEKVETTTKITGQPKKKDYNLKQSTENVSSNAADKHSSGWF